ncbi:DUF4241 domain-containing protein [Streptomyces sp. NPDC047097]|uniref:DUF4241 domain-containing protein n=1 Tax=Streptomyces sp. NPDC047097 TaxID=3155260 RepID=UPI0033D4AA02
MPMTAPDLDWYFTPGNRFERSGDHPLAGTMSVVRAPGELWLPSGRVTACDPFVSLGTGEAEPFTAAVPPGRYPVECAVATLTHPGQEPADRPHQRVAAARLLISGAPALSWEPALLAGQDLSELGEEEFYGYGVDAGTGCFYDAACDESFPEDEDGESPVWYALFGGEEPPDDLGPYLVDAPEGGHNLVAFTSGWGDGAYPTWVGRGADGQVVSFVTDFHVVPDGVGARA